jgi:predicted nucleic acid-binding protein
MIIADSSAWVDFIRRPEERLGPPVRELLEQERLAMVGMVLAELLTGLRRDPSGADNLILAVPFVQTDKDAWIRAGMIARDLERQGTPIPLGDVVIAATAMEGDHELLTRDKHFERIPGLKLYKWEDADA